MKAAMKNLASGSAALAAILLVFPANMLAACACLNCPCFPAAAEKAVACCIPDRQLCHAIAAPAGCKCSVGDPVQPADARAFAKPRANDFAVSGNVPPGGSPNGREDGVSLGATTMPLAAGPPIRALFCVWRI
jgi:hypothetical protein